ncbi:MAG: minor capsid protein [Clostridiales Family XIII bacterium]|jgi:SPP1 gp7 family putative phage head morphogenesis protein|nr:minor capsid protein [Clostridiales Family XIII bacterium]
MKNAEYWKKRAEILEDARHGEAEAYAAQIAREYDKYSARTRADIERWYQRLADNNGLSLAGAHKLLKAGELDEFHWDVEEYQKRGRENAIDQRWMKQLENASAKVHISRLEAAQTEMQQQVEMLAAGQERGMTRLLGDTFKKAYGQTAFELQKGIGVGFGIYGVDPRAVADIIRKPWTTDRRSFSDRIWTNKVELLARLQTDLTQAVMRGDNPKTLAAGIAKDFGTSKYKAERLVLTEAAYFSAQGQKDAYKELGVEAVEFVATLDHRTSAECRSMDGQIIAMKDYEPGVTVPPLHPFCRSTTAPWFDDDFTEVDYRASRDEAGKTVYEVPSDMTYPEWAETFMGGEKGVASTGKGSIIKAGQEESLLKKLPNAVSASTTQEKLQGYLLNSNHPVGGNKARVIRSVLGYHYQNWDVLADKIYIAVQDASVVRIMKTRYGVKYETHLLIEGEKGKSLLMRTIWQIDNESDIPRLVTITFDRRKGVK